MLRRHAGTSTAKKSVKRQLTISRKGWDVVWAAKKQKLLNILEDAYPNVLNIDDLARCVLASSLLEQITMKFSSCGSKYM